ncbi:MAG: DUF4231 domain-containing protein [Acidimicrobiia bacterium]|nr:DUF4231 domain-containing protein [Acidimicrobiia bacterium]
MSEEQNVGAVADLSEPQIRRAVADLPLDDSERAYLIDRLVDQLAWFERKSARNQKLQRWYRITALAGGLLLPVLVNETATSSEDWVRIAAISVSLVVGMAAGLETFLRPGDKWLQYRQSAEKLRSEWWMYVNLAGPFYAGSPSHEAAFRTLVERVESIVSDDVAGFVAIVTPNTQVPGQQPPGPDDPSASL